VVTASKNAIDKKGYVTVYDDSTGDWSQIGNTVQEETVRENFGSDISISHSGHRIAVASHNANISGQVLVYQYLDALTL